MLIVVGYTKHKSFLVASLHDRLKALNVLIYTFDLSLHHTNIWDYCMGNAKCSDKEWYDLLKEREVLGKFEIKEL